MVCGTGRSLKFHITPDIRERLLANYAINTETDCWEWQRAKYPAGYGTIKIQGKTYGTHRVMYRMWYGEFDYSLFVCHKCDNRICINPDHLFLGTGSDNMKDAFAKGRLDDALSKANRCVMRGADNPGAKLTWDQVDYIRKEYRPHDKEFGCKPLAKRFGINKRTLLKVISGEVYSRSSTG